MTEIKKLGLKNSKTITAIIIVLAVMEMAIIFAGNQLQMNSSKNLQTAYNNQLEYRTMASQLKETSDYLSNEVRLYAVTGDTTHFKNFWNEVKNYRHREEVINELEKRTFHRRKSVIWREPNIFSDTLMHIEISSMRLKIESDEYEGRFDLGADKDDFLEQCANYVRSYDLEKDFQCEDQQKRSFP